MTLLGFTGQAVSPPGTPAQAIAEAHLHFDEALACGRRLWIRGRLVDATIAQKAMARSQWKRWRRRPALVEQPQTIEIETRVVGQVVKSTAVLNAGGLFETAIEIDLPTARRGWRLARNRVCQHKQTLEKCCVVLSPPEDAAARLVVLLPLHFTFEAQGPERLARSESAAELTSILQQL